MADIYYYCRKCRTLKHPSEVYRDQGKSYHDVAVVLDSKGDERSIRHEVFSED